MDLNIAVVLSDCIKSIVSAQGRDVLYTNKIWFFISDVYNFENDAVLKHMFKECVDKGYIKQLCESKDRKGILSYIKQIILLEKGNGAPVTELTICLFSAAIGIGMCVIPIMRVFYF